MSEQTTNFAADLNLRSMAKLIDQLTAENAELRKELQGWQVNGTYSINLGIAAATEKLTKERDELKKRVKELNDECEAQQYQFDILKKDPACVWANMLRGTIATPSALVEAHDYQQIKAENAELRAKLEKAEGVLRCS